MQFQNSGGATTGKTQKFMAAAMALVLAIGLAPQFAAPAQAFADDGSDTFTVKTNAVEPSSQSGNPSGTGSGTPSATGDGPAAPQEQPAPAPAGLEVGKSTTAGTGAAAATVQATSDTAVTYVAPASKSTKKVTVPDTVTVDGKTYEVTSISASAFKGSKVKSLTVGKNVTSIGKGVGKSAKKLTKVTLKTSNLKKSAVKNLLKGSKIKTIKLQGVSKSAKKNYKKWAKAYHVKVK